MYFAVGLPNNGLYSIQALITLADSTTSFDFPDISTGFAEIHVDSLGYYKTFANIRWSVNGIIYLQASGSNVALSNTDGNHTILPGGTYATTVEIKNRMGYSCNYIIKYTYHF